MIFYQHLQGQKTIKKKENKMAKTKNPQSENEVNEKAPANILEQFEKLSSKLKKIQKEIISSLQTDEGIAKLKSYKLDLNESQDEGSISKKAKFVLELMQTDPQIENDFYVMAKGRKPKKPKE